MKSPVIVFFIVLGTCIYTANTDNYNYYGEEETDSTSPPTATAAPGSGACSTSMTPMLECELPQPALDVRLKTEEDALLLTDCYLHCLDMASKNSSTFIQNRVLHQQPLAYAGSYCKYKTKIIMIPKYDHCNQCMIMGYRFITFPNIDFFKR